MRSLTYEEVAKDYALETRLADITKLLSAPCDLDQYEQALLLQERHEILEKLEQRRKRAVSAPCPHCGRV